MKLPEVRTEMMTLAGRIRSAGLLVEASRLEALAEETRRRSPLSRAAPTAKPVTSAMIGEVMRVFQLHPGWSFRKIGQHCDVDQGRVSEIIRGKRP